MFKHFLIATDGSPLSESAALKRRAIGQVIVGAGYQAITVSTPFHVFTTDYGISDTMAAYNDDCTRRAQTTLDVVRKATESAGVSCDVMHVGDEHPYAAIIDAADKKSCDVICMASHGRKGVAGLVLGSQTTKVLTHSKIPVFV